MFDHESQSLAFVRVRRLRLLGGLLTVFRSLLSVNTGKFFQNFMMFAFLMNSATMGIEGGIRTVVWYWMKQVFSVFFFFVFEFSVRLKEQLVGFRHDRPQRRVVVHQRCDLTPSMSPAMRLWSWTQWFLFTSGELLLFPRSFPQFR